MVSLKQIISWFQTGLFPTAEQFRQTWLSYWHKSEKIPNEQIMGLQEVIDDSLENFYNKEEIDTDFYNKKYIEDNYPRASDIESNYYDKKQIDKEHYNKGQVNSLFYNKTEVYDKSEVDSKTINKKGYFTTEEKLYTEWPNPQSGWTAWVGTNYPGTVYDVVSGAWHNTGNVPPTDEVNLADYATKSELSELGNNIKDETTTNHIAQTATQNIKSIGELKGGDRIFIKCSNLEGVPSVAYNFQFNGNGQVVSWVGTEEQNILVLQNGAYSFITNIADTSEAINFSYDVTIRINGKVTYRITRLETDMAALTEKVEDNEKDISTLGIPTVYEEEASISNTKRFSLGNLLAGDKIRLSLSNIEKEVSDWSFYGWNLQIYDLTNKAIIKQISSEQDIEVVLTKNIEVSININVTNLKLTYKLSYEIERVGVIGGINENLSNINLMVGEGKALSYGEYDESLSPSNIYKFNTYKESKTNASTQQIHNLGLLPSGTIIKLSVNNWVATGGAGTVQHQINSVEKGVLASFWRYGSVTHTLTSAQTIRIVSNVASGNAASFDINCIYGDSFPVSTQLVVNKDSVINNNGVLKKIHIYVPNTGIYTFGVGTLDWRNWGIIRDTFNLTLNRGENLVYLQDKIVVNSGERLFLYVNKSGNDGLSCFKNAQTSENLFLIGEENGVLSEYQGNGYGGKLFFKAEYIKYDSIFALGHDVASLSGKTDSNSAQIQELDANINILKDETGNRYKLSVLNGNVIATLMQYSKALLIGNSLLMGMDYYTNPYGMLATNSDLDWAAHLLNGLNLKNSSSEIKRVPATPLERDVLNTNFPEMFSSIATWDFDLIVFQGGENVNSANYPNYQEALNNMIVYLKSKAPTAELVITGCVLMSVPPIESAAANVASKFGGKYVYYNGSTSEVKIGVSRMYHNNGGYHPSTFRQQTHLNDLGFIRLANKILSSIGYNAIEKTHEISLQNTAIQNDTPSYGVSGGIVTIKTYANTTPTIVVRDSGGATVPVSHYKLSDFDYDNRFADGTTDPATYSSTFEMPNTNVTVSIS